MGRQGVVMFNKRRNKRFGVFTSNTKDRSKIDYQRDASTPELSPRRHGKYKKSSKRNITRHFTGTKKKRKVRRKGNKRK